MITYYESMTNQLHYESRCGLHSDSLELQVTFLHPPGVHDDDRVKMTVVGVPTIYEGDVPVAQSNGGRET